MAFGTSRYLNELLALRFTSQFLCGTQTLADSGDYLLSVTMESDWTL